MMLSNGWALLFGLVLFNNKSQENVHVAPLQHQLLRMQFISKYVFTIKIFTYCSIIGQMYAHSETI